MAVPPAPQPALNRLGLAAKSLLNRPALTEPIARLRATRARRLAAKVARAADPATPKLTLLTLALISGRRTPVARALAANRSTPRICLRVFAHGPWDVAAAVAGNASTPQRVLARAFMHRPAWAVRSALASNASAPGIALQRMATSPEVVVRMQVAAHPALPTQTVGVLLRDHDVYVRAVAAGNPKASASGLEQLVRPMTDPAWVLRAAATNPACPQQLADEVLTWIALGGTGNTDPTFDPLTCTGHPGDTTVSVWSWYRQAAIQTGEGAEMHPLWRVRSVITTSWQRIPGRVLMALAIDPRDEVRLSVSRFKELTFARLKHLAQDADPLVAAAAIRAIKQKRKSKTFWRRFVIRRGFLLPLFLVATVTSSIIGGHVSSSDAPSPQQITADWPGETDNGLPEQLVGGGQVLAEPLDAQGAGVLTFTTGSIPFDIKFPQTVDNTLGSPLGTEVRLGTYTSVTIIVSPPRSRINVLVTTNENGYVATANLPIIYEELPQ